MPIELHYFEQYSMVWFVWMWTMIFISSDYCFVSSANDINESVRWQSKFTLGWGRMSRLPKKN